MEIELHYFDDCPNWETTDRYLRALVPGASARVRRRLVRTPEEAEHIGFRGSPTVLGVDVPPNAVDGR